MRATVARRRRRSSDGRATVAVLAPTSRRYVATESAQMRHRVGANAAPSRRKCGAKSRDMRSSVAANRGGRGPSPTRRDRIARQATVREAREVRNRKHRKLVLSPLAAPARPIQRLGPAPSCRAPWNCPMTPRAAFSSTRSLRGCCLQTEVRSRHRARRGCAEGRARAPTLSMCGGDGSGQRCRSSPGTCSRGLAGWGGRAICPELTRGSHSHQG